MRSVSPQSRSIKILSYNIHKGVGSGLRKKQILTGIREALHTLQPDLVFLQEVLGRHDGHSKRIVNWPTRPQTEYLAEGLWPHHSYGKNAIYTLGHHGNAILSKFPITASENLDISKSKLESRGLLHATLQLPHSDKPLHAICTHLGLFETDRKEQIADLSKRIGSLVPTDEALIVGGDFNDWREKTSDALAEQSGLQEVFLTLHGEHAKTFPVWLPMLRLDRIYYRGLKALRAESHSAAPWDRLSDHAAVSAEFSFPRRSRHVEV
jgi:endonuclease/exonuclease/phosphatase family metal-dependent hydrolase